MRKGSLFFIFLLFVVIAQSFFTGCSSSKVKVIDPVVGIINVVGNEPFVRLAVNIDNRIVYFLECDKTLSDELWKNQGRVYEIIYSDVKQNEEGITLVVKKAIPIKTN